MLPKPLWNHLTDPDREAHGKKRLAQELVAVALGVSASTVIRTIAKTEEVGKKRRASVWPKPRTKREVLGERMRKRRRRQREAAAAAEAKGDTSARPKVISVAGLRPISPRPVRTS